MSTAVQEVVTAVRNSLIMQGNASRADGARKYFKNVIDFYGLSSPDTQKLAASFAPKIDSFDKPQLFDLISNLFNTNFLEEKSIGTLFLAKKKKKLGKEEVLFVGRLYDDGKIYDWGTSDSVSSRILAEALRNDKKLAQIFVDWRDSPNLWKQRASCVTFVKHARFGGFNKEIFDIASVCISSQERFVQLGVGWLLRELSRATNEEVVKFIKNNYSKFSREGLRYAIEKMDGDLRNRLLKYKPRQTEEEE
eukprot:TRINITY_DN6388_c0_g1_i1.p1 TRINITY_DN6388_c0_g1~~TRINITY_DN6388_c0_g1_i1.p1  ORF type:complete len:250 (+),score=49.04 TRINITY_DN6388_c0_g1_i1:52-801(+)